MKRKSQLVALMAGLLLFAACATADMGQAAKKKTYTFKGRVESIDEKAKNMTINGENVDGWMAAMTMAYEVDDPATLKKVKVGDKISATVYDGDYKLYKVQVLPKDERKSDDKKMDDKSKPKK